MEQFERRKGVFNPKKTDELAPGVEKLIGIQLTWEAMWLIKDGRYQGMCAMSPRVGADECPYLPFSWVPECDIDFN